MLALATDLGVSVRPARPEDVAALVRLRRRSWREAYRDILPDVEVERATGPSSAHRLRRAFEGRARGQRLLVAERAGEGLLGYAWCGAQSLGMLEHRGEVYELYLDPGAQRQGVGSRLLDAAIWSLVDLGLHPVLVWVLAQNPARYFYEMRGGVVVAKGTIRVGDYVTTRVAYGWSDALPVPYSRRSASRNDGLVRGL